MTGASPDAAYARHVFGLRVQEYTALENVVGNIDTHEQPCVKAYRMRPKPSACNLSSRKGQERHHEQMNEVDPYQSQRRSAHKPHKVMMVYPNNGDEELRRRIADGRRPEGPESPECRAIWCSPSSSTMIVTMTAKMASESAASRCAAIFSSRIIPQTLQTRTIPTSTVKKQGSIFETGRSRCKAEISEGSVLLADRSRRSEMEASSV